MDDRLLHGAQTKIVHLFRTYIDGTERRQHGRPRRLKTASSCDAAAPTAGPTRASTTRSRCGAASSSSRCASSRARSAPSSTSGWAAPTRRTASYWQKQMKQGRQEGWYQLVVGTVDKMQPQRRPDRQPRPHRRRASVPVEVDFIIDCTGLEADIAEHRLLADLLEHGGAGRNPLGRLDVERNFEVTRHPQRRRRDVRLGRDHAGRLLPRRRHVPRPAGRGPGDRRRPRQARVRQAHRPGPLDQPVVQVAAHGRRTICDDAESPDAAHPERPDPDPDLPARRGRRH